MDNYPSSQKIRVPTPVQTVTVCPEGVKTQKLDYTLHITGPNK